MIFRAITLLASDRVVRDEPVDIELLSIEVLNSAVGIFAGRPRAVETTFPSALGVVEVHCEVAACGAALATYALEGTALASALLVGGLDAAEERRMLDAFPRWAEQGRAQRGQPLAPSVVPRLQAVRERPFVAAVLWPGLPEGLPAYRNRQPLFRCRLLPGLPRLKVLTSGCCIRASCATG